MSRLLEGDVGSGKTLVAVIALLNVALNGKQAALMVPTEILAEQHFQAIKKLLAPYNFKIELLTHSHKTKKATDANIVIGTQALIQENVKFHDLALVIVDEQHRFGVKQRQKLLTVNSKKDNKHELTPHFLSMTATPIPRSLALAIYGDLDISLINQMPAKRKKIITKLITEEKRQAAYHFIREQINSGRQAFVVCPLIDESDKLGVKSVKKEHEKLDKEIFPELKVGLLHGRLKAKEKEAVMTDFLANKIQILVSTSVIEVGIDVPNATIMIIEGAERFGLATLHQFRGRVGRSDYQSYCFLFPSNEELNNPKTLERLAALTKYNDGFSLAKIDLKLRGAGEIYGISQSGFPELQIASLFDYESIKKAQEEASALVAQDPELTKYPLLRAKLGEWEDSVHLE
jgi:ATP-dependent DNA helicase RecG